MKPVRVARGTLPPVQVVVARAGFAGPRRGAEGGVESIAPITFAEASGPIDVVIAPTLRMTLHPPRFTTTTPGVMRRQPR